MMESTGTIRAYRPIRGDYALEQPEPSSQFRDPLGWLLHQLTVLQTGTPGVSHGALPIGPGGFQVSRGSGSAKQVRALDDLIQFLSERIPNAIRKFGEWRPITIKPGSSRMKGTAETLNDVDWPLLKQPVNIKVRPDVLSSENRIEGAKTIMHELFHPKLDEVFYRRPDLVEKLGRSGADRLDEILQSTPTDQLHSFWNNLNRGYYRGNDLWEELAVRLMEHNVAKRRFRP